MVLIRWCSRDSSEQPFKLSDWMIAKPFLLGLEWTLMILTVFLGRSAFLAHVFVVTYLLLIVLYKINQLYGKFGNPHYLFFVVVMGGGVVHAMIPVVGHFFHDIMYAHLGICFMVHVLHLSQCYTVFNDITFKDEDFITILWTVNIAEMLVNIAFVFDGTFSEEQYIACALAVQTMALMIVNLNLKIGGGSAVEISTNSSISENGSYNGAAAIPSMMANWLGMLSRAFMSRVGLMIISSVSVALMALFSEYRFLIFMISVAILTRLVILKIAKVCSLVALNLLLDRVFLLCSLVMIAFAAITQTGLLQHTTGVVLSLVALIWAFGVLFSVLYILTDGQCYSVVIIVLMLLTSSTTSILYLLEGHATREMLLFGGMTVSCAVLFCSSKLRVADFRGYRVHPVGGKVRVTDANSDKAVSATEKVVASMTRSTDNNVTLVNFAIPLE